MEISSALARLLRNGEIAGEDFKNAARRLEAARQGWVEVLPSERLRDLAQDLVERLPRSNG